MTNIVNKFLLAQDKFMPEMRLKQPGFTYSADGPFTKNKERIEKFMQARNTNLMYRNELDKACFQHDMVYGKSKELAKRTQSDKVLRDKAFNISTYNKGNSVVAERFIRTLKSKIFKHMTAVSKIFISIC